MSASRQRISFFLGGGGGGETTLKVIVSDLALDLSHGLRKQSIFLCMYTAGFDKSAELTRPDITAFKILQNER